mmetsp:Transcript_27041/g.54026  ORF Transcript_27041/g.54026 Transcript_27041/m.54026 type:complete len:97 (+) Transcript_27041:166-456(+)
MFLKHFENYWSRGAFEPFSILALICFLCFFGWVVSSFGCPAEDFSVEETFSVFTEDLKKKRIGQKNHPTLKGTMRAKSANLKGSNPILNTNRMIVL